MSRVPVSMKGVRLAWELVGFLIAAAGASTLLSGCQAEIDSGEPRQIQLRHGKFRLQARGHGQPSSDGPALVHAVVSVERIDIRSTDGRWYRFSIEPQSMDLLNLNVSTGIVLARAKVPAGEYDLVRLGLSDEPGLATFDDRSQLPLTIPSGTQSGLKVFFSPPLAIAEAELVRATLDFDLGESFHFTNNGVTCRPVIRGIASELEDVTEEPPAGGGTGDTGGGDTGSGDSGSGDTGSSSSSSSDPSDTSASPDPTSEPDDWYVPVIGV